MTESLKRIGPDRLDERLHASSWPRELQPVAMAFDTVLERLEDSFTRLSQFSADLAHELRTPIANLRGESEVALTRTRTPDEYREVIESSVAECERLSGIIDNLLFLARAEAANGHIERIRFDGRAAIEKVAAYFRTIAEDRNIEIKCAGEGEIDADPLLFSRAVSNLVDNALRFTPDGGIITIAVAVKSNRLRSVGARQRKRHRAGTSATSLRSLLPRGFLAQLDGNRPWTRAGEINRRPARRFGERAERSRPRHDCHVLFPHAQRGTRSSRPLLNGSVTSGRHLPGGASKQNQQTNAARESFLFAIPPARAACIDQLHESRAPASHPQSHPGGRHSRRGRACWFTDCCAAAKR